MRPLTLVRLASLFLLSSLIVTPPTFAEVTVDLDAGKVACAIRAAAMTGGYGQQNFIADISEAVRRTTSFTFSSVDDNYFRKQIYARLRAHSYPLVTEKFLNKAPVESVSWWKTLASLRYEAVESRPEIRDLTTAQLDLEDSYRKTPAEEVENFGDPDQVAIKKVLRLANPLIGWLLLQPKESVDVLSLVRQALPLFKGNLVVTLGVIGTIFDEERMVSHPRNKLALLGSKMHPLFVGDQNSVGPNYHFWAYLNMALKGDRFQPSWFSFFQEKVYQKDEREYQADQLGLKVGAEVRDLMFHPTMNCY